MFIRVFSKNYLYYLQNIKQLLAKNHLIILPEAAISAPSNYMRDELRRIDYMAKNKEVANDNAYLNKVISKQLYYDNLIKNGIPDYVRALNFTYFTDYNLTKLSATYYVEKTQKKATIFNGMNQMIKTINIT